MTDLFKDMLKGEESLFLDELPLDFEYMPPIIKFRENEQHHLATCIKPLFQERNGKNLLIFGHSGIGKTVAIKHVFNELKKETEDVIPIYINCWKTDTSYKIALEICNQLDYKFVQNKKTDELLKEIAKILNKKAVVFCFDECDKVSDLNFLYSILEDIYRKSIFLITNNKSWTTTVDQRIKSRLTPEFLEFRAYNFDETEGILKQRIGYAFAKNVFEKEAFEIITKKTFEMEDIRSGLFLLKESGNLAENESSKKILLSHADQAIKKLKNFKIKSSSDLEADEKQILDIIKENSGRLLKELYDIYKANGGKKTYRTFTRKIEELEKGELISTEEKGKTISIKYGTKQLTEF